MPQAMYILTIESQGLMLDCRFNDVRVFQKRDGRSSRAGVRVNPWLVSGGNGLMLYAVPAPKAVSSTEPATGSELVKVEESLPPKLRLKLVRGIQGQAVPEDLPALFQFNAEASELAGLPARQWTALIQQRIEIGALPWRSVWVELPAFQADLPMVSRFLDDYLRILRQMDQQALETVNRLRTAILTESLGVSPESVHDGYRRLLALAAGDQWQRKPDAELQLGKEGGGRLCRVESRQGGPVIYPAGADAGSGLVFSVACVKGQLWVVA